MYTPCTRPRVQHQRRHTKPASHIRATPHLVLVALRPRPAADNRRLHLGRRLQIDRSAAAAGPAAGAELARSPSGLRRSSNGGRRGRSRRGRREGAAGRELHVEGGHLCAQRVDPDVSLAVGLCTEREGAVAALLHGAVVRHLDALHEALVGLRGCGSRSVENRVQEVRW